MATKKTTVTKTKKYTLTPKEAEDVIEKEFSDKKGNKIKFQFDFKPHQIKEPTITGGFNYGDKK